MHLGIMGPPIRAIVGERIKIIFYNKASGNYSMHPHGVEYNSLSEGAMYQNGKKNFQKSVLLNGGQKVFPGSKWIYIWDARDNSGGSDNEISSKFWFYHSHIDETKDTNTGLVGPIIITKKDYETDINNNNLKPNDIDREFITLFTVFNENESHYLRYNLQTFATGTNNNNNNNTEFTDELLDEFDFDDEDFQESNLMHSMNGFVYNAIGKYQNNILKGEKIRWYIGGMGTEVDIHSAHWHGNIIKKNNYIYEDVVLLMPAYSITVDMYADNSGVWFYHCHVNDHVEAGMISTYTVTNKTCINCVGRNSNNNNKNSNNNFDMISDVLSSNETWIVVLICFIMNWIGFICILMIYKYCLNKKRNKKKEYVGVVEIKNDDLKESMLSNNRKGTDLQMTEKNFV